MRSSWGVAASTVSCRALSATRRSPRISFWRVISLSRSRSSSNSTATRPSGGWVLKRAWRDADSSGSPLAISASRRSSRDNFPSAFSWAAVSSFIVASCFCRSASKSFLIAAASSSLACTLASRSCCRFSAAARASAFSLSSCTFLALRALRALSFASFEVSSQALKLLYDLESASKSSWFFSNSSLTSVSMSATALSSVNPKICLSLFLSASAVSRAVLACAISPAAAAAAASASNFCRKKR